MFNVTWHVYCGIILRYYKDKLDYSYLEADQTADSRREAKEGAIFGGAVTY